VAGARFDLLLVLVFAVVGYAFKKLDYPIAPLVLAMVLGDKAGDAFRQSMIISEGSFAIFGSNPLVTVLFALGIVLLVWPMLSGGVRMLLPRRAAKADLLTE
jgi:TctA family transporter